MVDTPLAEPELPQELRDRLASYRRRLWSVRIAEAVGVSVVFAAASYLALFGSDRLFETPVEARLGLLLFGLVGFGLYLPWRVYRWVWGTRRWTEVAKVLGIERPDVGDRLLGSLELADSRREHAKSPVLVRAAIQQVADDTRSIDFHSYVPNPRHKRWAAWASGVGLVMVAALAVPGAGINAFLRWIQPFADIERYTFAQLASTPDSKVVPIAERFEVKVALSDETVISPSSAKAWYGDQEAVEAELVDGEYVFEFPAQTDEAKVKIKVGDARRRIEIRPIARPELRGLYADVELPAYLQRDGERFDARGGSLSVLEGSTVSLEAEASRDLNNARWNDDSVNVSGARLTTGSFKVDGDSEQVLRWEDVEGLTALEPFVVRVRAVEDAAPTVYVANLLPEQVVLDAEVLNFPITTSDDYGVKAVGLSWQGIVDPKRNPEPAQGELMLAAGNPQASHLAVDGVFSAARQGIEPQAIELRVFVEDYNPEAERVYSMPYRLYVLDAEEHMMWITQQLRDWESDVLEVRDEEERLLERNEELAELSPEDAGKPETRRDIARQAAAERANSRRLDGLTKSGNELISQALRNPEFNAATLEKWAAQLEALEQLASKRMPSVANLLAQASQGQPSQSPPPTTPTVSDVEGGLAKDPGEESSEPSPPSSGGSRLGLATTSFGQGPDPEGGTEPEECPPPMEMAVDEQRALLEEFNRVMDEIADILRNLYGSTFVKRLKHASRQELRMASTLQGRIEDTFGEEHDALKDFDQATLERLRGNHGDTTEEVRLIQEDLIAYFERTQQDQFEDVYVDMKQKRVVQNFRGMGDALTDNLSGSTIAEAEYWSDQLTLWAEMLVGPG